jgi:hypothetical protein
LAQFPCLILTKLGKQKLLRPTRAQRLLLAGVACSQKRCPHAFSAVWMSTAFLPDRYHRLTSCYLYADQPIVPQDEMNSVFIGKHQRLHDSVAGRVSCPAGLWCCLFGNCNEVHIAKECTHMLRKSYIVAFGGSSPH